MGSLPHPGGRLGGPHGESVWRATTSPLTSSKILEVLCPSLYANPMLGLRRHWPRAREPLRDKLPRFPSLASSKFLGREWIEIDCVFTFLINGLWVWKHHESQIERERLSHTKVWKTFELNQLKFAPFRTSTGCFFRI